MAVGSHLPAQWLALKLRVFRTPINDALALRANHVCRLLSYRSMQDRSRHKEHCQQHLHLLDLLEQDRNEEASQAMHDHLSSTLRDLQGIRDIL